MAQVTIYLPEKLARAVRARARREGKSVSAYVGELVQRDAGGRKWPRELVEILSRGKGDIVEPDDPPPEDVEPL